MQRYRGRAPMGVWCMEKPKPLDIGLYGVVQIKRGHFAFFPSISKNTEDKN